MATQSPDIVLDVAAISARLLEAQEVAPRAGTIAKAIAGLLPGTAANIYVISESPEGKVWSVRGNSGDAVPDKTIPIEAGTLGILARGGKALLLTGHTLKREEYAHLNVRRTVHSLAYAPLVTDGSVLGAIEVVSFDEPSTEAQLQTLQVVAGIAAPAIAAAQAYEEERHNSLTSVSRLTQFYDIEKVFHSTLEMDQLLPIMGTKICEVLECQAVNIWLLEGDESLKLMHQAGIDPTVQEGMHERPGEGIAGDVSDSGEAVLIADPDDERLQKRNHEVGEGRLESLLVVPLIDDGSLVGVIEAANRLDGAPLDEDDLFVLTNLCETASSALHNASLLLAERKVEILETLVTVSHEITSTLNLERMLQTIVNAPQAIIPYERAAIGLEQHGKYRLSAVTGVTQLDPNAPEVASLNDILRWAILSEEVVHVKQHGDEISDAREETQAKFRAYFQETGMRGFYAVPLSDDTGRVGILGLESSDPDFLSSAHLEILQVLAGQATVALRNAQMYKEVPFISVLEPVLERKRKFMAMEKRRRTAILVLAAAAVVFLAIFPLPLRVDGDAVVAPARSAQIQPEVEGVVSRVLVREGEHVAKGQVVAEMADWDYRSSLAQAQAKYQTSQLQMNRALASNDGSEAGVQRVQADYWKGEVERARQLLERTQLRSPIDGVVATPHIEDMAGRRLQFGDSLAEVVDASHAVVDVAIDETDASLLRAGAHSVVKLNSYPTRTFRGTVAVVSPMGALQGDSRVFFARVSVPNADNAIRTGMEGRGKVSVGWYPAGYVIFRHAGMWLYQHIWAWFGW
ncbi:MAG TPA: efflux RND transporter periplasmic adaptor subunit [Terriglobales bacterium]|nr:efflux RND transporter periplasmic adaptor subunit [Terriglobales bacterium]